MWIQDYNPLNNTYLSALVAAFPVTFLSIGSTVIKMKGIITALLTLIISIGVSAFLFQMLTSWIVVRRPISSK
ncbi:L-lactate permease [Peribacillus frigoritolerans]|uniref:L-lactate permease n=1 Tax=Peribacillus frigoritolerans TaxID=450367 RepID=UPI00201C2072|nr:L-lactate permease [Peribacillus frigoritolerans]